MRSRRPRRREGAQKNENTAPIPVAQRSIFVSPSPLFSFQMKSPQQSCSRSEESPGLPSGIEYVPLQLLHTTKLYFSRITAIETGANVSVFFGIKSTQTGHVIQKWNSNISILEMEIKVHASPISIVYTTGFICSLLSDGTVVILDANSGNTVKILTIGRDRCRVGSLFRSGRWLICIHRQDGVLMRNQWAVDKWQLTYSFGFGNNMQSVFPNPKWATLCIGVYSQRYMKIIDEIPDSLERNVRQVPWSYGQVTCIAWWGRSLFISGTDLGYINLWSISTFENKPRMTVKHYRGVNSLCIRNGVLMSTGVGIGVWLLSNGTLLQSIATFGMPNIDIKLSQNCHCYVECMSGTVATFNGGILRMSRKSLMPLLLWHKYGNCLSFSSIPMDIIKIIIRMVDVMIAHEYVK